MTNPSLRTRIFLSYFLLIALAAILLNWFFGNRIVAITEDAFFDSFYQKIEIVMGSLEGVADKIPPAQDSLGERLFNLLEEGKDPSESDFGPIFKEITKLVASQNVHIMLILSEEELVLFDSRNQSAPYPMGDWEEVWAVLEGEEPIQEEYIEQEEIYYADVLFYESAYDEYDESLIVRLGDSQRDVRTNIQRQRIVLAVSTLLGGLVLLFALGGWMASTLTRPLTDLRATVQAMTTGNLGARTDTKAPIEIRQLAADFNQMAEAVEAMMAEQKAFASNAAHELRTPLTAIRIRTEALLEDDPDEALIQQYIREIDDESNRLTRLIEDLRFLSQADSQNLAVGIEQVDVGRVIYAVQQELAPQIQGKNLDLSLQLPYEPVLLRSSMAQLRVVIRNLIENAVKYTPEDGKINVMLEQCKDDVQITIADNGIGIASADLPNLFTRFYRVEKSRNRKVPGMGLGLSLVQSIVELYGGTIVISSDGLGKGTTAQVRFPVIHHTCMVIQPA